MSSLTSKARVVIWTSFTLLLAQQLIELVTRQAPWVIWLAVLLPLLIFIPGMRQDNLRSYIWLCFVLLLYFMRLVVALFADPGSPTAIVGMVSVVTLFVTGMMYVRWRARELREAVAHHSGHGE